MTVNLSALPTPRIDMGKLLFFSFLLGTTSLVLTMIIIVAVTTVMKEPLVDTMWINAIIGNYAIGIPVCYFCLRQANKEKQTLAALGKINSELAEAHGALEEQARIDPLTGFLNRETFYKTLSDDPKRLAKGTLMIMDADHFKLINDTHGHLAGDEALRLIADAIRSAVDNKGMAGRVGGEEFAVFLPTRSPGIVEAMAGELLKSVRAVRFRPTTEAALIPLSISIGASVATPFKSLNDLMREADNALYAAKDAGRNCFRALPTGQPQSV